VSVVERSAYAFAPSLDYEMALWEGGYRYIAGIDEAGRGALAGPVAAGVVILPQMAGLLDKLQGVRDSKLMTPNARLAWREVICQTALCWAVGFANHEEVDAYGVVPATHLAVTRAIEQLNPGPVYLLSDFLILPELDFPQTALVKGDRLALSVAAGSILAKTARDQFMIEAGKSYPAYGFAQHKGYGTRQHRQALSRFGGCPLHRKSFHYTLEDLNETILGNLGER
jgi:ribonuclease HII